MFHTCRIVQAQEPFLSLYPSIKPWPIRTSYLNSQHLSFPLFPNITLSWSAHLVLVVRP